MLLGEEVGTPVSENAHFIHHLMYTQEYKEF